MIILNKTVWDMAVFCFLRVPPPTRRRTGGGYYLLK